MDVAAIYLPLPLELTDVLPRFVLELKGIL
jgi:hypothetical protein